MNLDKLGRYIRNFQAAADDLAADGVAADRMHFRLFRAWQCRPSAGDPGDPLREERYARAAIRSVLGTRGVKQGRITQ